MPSFLICMYVFVKLITNTTATKLCSQIMVTFLTTFCGHWLVATKRVHQERHCRIEFDCKENVPTNTTAYCLILHDRVVEYCLLSNVMRKIIQVTCEYVGINKNWNALQWSIVSKNCSSWSYQRLWTYKDSLLRVGLSWRKWRCWKKERSLLLYFCKLLSMKFTYKIRKILRFLVDCESSWIAMGSQNDPVKYGETSYYIGCS